MAWYKCANDTDIRSVLRKTVSISVTTPPNKINYVPGDILDLTGIVVKATLGTGEMVNITSKCSFSPSNGSVLSSNNNITISYTEEDRTYSTIYDLGIKIVTWSAGTDAEIVQMVQNADEGRINLSDYWTVGDERLVTLSSMTATGVEESHSQQTVRLVLMHAGLYELVDGGTCNFIVGQKNGLATGGYMNSSNTNSESWNGSKRRTWCNNIYYNAIPETLRPIFKKFKTVTAKTYNGSTNQTSEDYFALPAEKEIFGSIFHSNTIEANALTQFDYYKTSANRIKRQGNGGSASGWWERSPYWRGSSSFCYVDSDGSAGASGASNTNLLAPFGCI